MLASLVLFIAPPVLVAGASPTAPAAVAVVCPAPLQPRLAPWLEHRRAQGYQLAVIEPAATPQATRHALLQVHRQQPLNCVVLVGDVPNENSAVPGTAVQKSLGTPTHLLQAKVNVRWGSEPQIASDHPYADLTGDGLPDVAVGRLPADTPQDLSAMIDKTIRYERCLNFGPWRRQIQLVAGVGGFGALADAAIEAATKKLLTDEIPAGYQTQMTYGSWRSPFCPDPRLFRQTTVGTLNNGCLFWVYLGHGHRQAVDRVYVPGGAFPVFELPDAQQLTCRVGQPIACLLACYTGAFDHDDCLAEELLRAEGGPVAVFAGSRVTMPYAMSVMALAMLETCFSAQPHADSKSPRTLGEAICRAKRRMMDDQHLSPNRSALDSLASLVSPAPVDLKAERSEHLLLFNLLGDPLLQLPQPKSVVLAATIDNASGHVQIAGQSTIAGKATFELVTRRDRTPNLAKPRRQFEPSHQFLSSLQNDYRQANDSRLASHTMEVIPGKFDLQLPLPPDTPLACQVRVFVEGQSDCALGACDITIAP